MKFQIYLRISEREVPSKQRLKSSANREKYNIISPLCAKTVYASKHVTF
ncbi:hypothetical protein SAMN02910409_0898 [Prevotellaceae bacterium HUN156]|nr:hypothetical protein SAMN02910409_0898 [Prevotellaceae bacterium HUN156]